MQHRLPPVFIHTIFRRTISSLSERTGHNLNPYPDTEIDSVLADWHSNVDRYASTEGAYLEPSTEFTLFVVSGFAFDLIDRDIKILVTDSDNNSQIMARKTPGLFKLRTAVARKPMAAVALLSCAGLCDLAVRRNEPDFDRVLRNMNLMLDELERVNIGSHSALSVSKTVQEMANIPMEDQALLDSLW